MTTVLQIKLMLHYYAINEPYAMRNQAHANSEAVSEQRQILIDCGMLIPAEVPSGFKCSKAGDDYVARLKAVSW
jgi:hypothetical protein